MRAAVDDVQHRHGQDVRAHAADPAVQRHPCVRGTGLRGRERDSEDRVGAEPRLVRRPVELDQPEVERTLILRIEAGDRVRDLRVDVPHRGEHALAPVGARVTVAQLDRLELPRRGARRDRGPADRARLEHDVDLDGRVPARVENLPRLEPGRSRTHHRDSSLARSKYRSCSCGPSAENVFPSPAA